MSSSMHFQITSLRKWLGTLTTRKWFLSNMSSTMLLQTVPPSENDLVHWSQRNGFSPVWVLLCIFKMPPSENDLVHWPQGNGFSPVWVLLCFFKLPPSDNYLVHWSQQNLHIINLRKLLRTLITKKWFHSFVLLQIAIFWKWLGKLVTRKWLFYSMCSSVHLQTVTLWK